jgi:hypothetical protein
MTPHKAVRITTPTPEQLQALYDLPSDCSDQEWSNRKRLRRHSTLDEAEPAECYNETLRSIDALFDAASGGSEDAKEFLRTVAHTALILGQSFM